MSTITTSSPLRSASFRAAFATLTGSRPSETTGTPISSPRVKSCSTAAGRSRSAATRSGRRPSFFSRSASFADAVVFPEPWTPAIMTTAVRAEGTTNRTNSPPSVACSSSRTTLITCCAGVRLFMTSSESARVRTRARKASATSTATSASSNAVRMSSRALSTCLGCNLPRERSFLNVPSSFAVSVSNIASGLPSAFRESREPTRAPGSSTASYSPGPTASGPRTSSTAWSSAIGLNGFVK